MLNQIILAGRLVSDPEITNLENEKKKSSITIAIPRNYKNAEGVYDTDFIKCILWNGIAENVVEYCKKGDVVGVKGRLQTSSYEKDNKTIYTMDVVAEKVSFLSSRKKEEPEMSV